MTSQSETLSLLRDTLSEARASVRAYDTKAQIVSVGYIFTLGVLSQVGSTIGQPPQVDLKLLITFWAIVIVPILLFGFVLYPAGRQRRILTPMIQWTSKNCSTSMPGNN